MTFSAEGNSGLRHMVELTWAEGHDLKRVARFAVIGTGATLLNLLLLWLFVAMLDMSYIEGSILAFVIALFCNFLCQKIWTFASPRPRARCAHAQLIQFAVVNLFKLSLNTALVYLMVGIGGMAYLVGQSVSSAVIAVESYYAYRWIFR
ncbi:MAG TPA: GtrA family protein [Rhizomicrobium sp.]|jgi:putative flippase GtrA|nr:GtrA family protein [Rhizomicrobium sp.]